MFYKSNYIKKYDIIFTFKTPDFSVHRKTLYYKKLKHVKNKVYTILNILNLSILCLYYKLEEL